MTAITPMAYVRAIVSTYRRYGIDPSAALAAAQIAPDNLRAPGGRITARQMEQVSEAAMRELGDEALGAFSRRLPWGSYGMLLRASISSPTLGVALRRWCRHHGLLTDDLTLSLGAAGTAASLTIDEHRPPGVDREFALVHLMRNIHGLSSWLVDSRIPLVAARFPFAAPSHAGVYRALFPGPSVFDCARAELAFDARYLGLPVRRDETALNQLLKRALPLTVLQYRRDRLLVRQVRQALASDPARAGNAEALAAQLNISARTLHRQLRDEGASLQQIKDEVRHERARELLNRTTRPLKQVAAAVGFASEKSFIRAFRGWEGRSPTEFRQSGA